MKSHLACGFATLLGAASGAWAIEPPVAPAPIPPQVTPEEAVAPQVEEPHARELPVPGQDPAVEAAPPVVLRGYLGVGGSQVPELLGEHLGLQPGEGVVVRSLDPAGPAAQAGLQYNDIITRISGKRVGSHDELRGAVAAFKPGDDIDIDFIHKGEPKAVKVALGTAPEDPGLGAMQPKPLERLMLDGMPQDQARRIQDAIQQNLKEFEELDGQGAFPEDILSGAMRKRVEQMMQGFDLETVPQGGIGFKSSGTIRMLNADGTGVEVFSENGSKQVRVLGKGGQVEWEGPYDTPQDKEAVPQEYRDRIENLNLDPDFTGQGLRLRMAPRFKPLER